MCKRDTYASAEISVGCEMKSIGRLCLLRFPGELLDLFQKHGPRRFEDFSFMTLRNFDLRLLCPKTQVRNVRTVSEFIAETAAPANKVFCLHVRFRRRSIE
jgi:hypothetical protein